MNEVCVAVCLSLMSERVCVCVAGPAGFQDLHTGRPRREIGRHDDAWSVSMQLSAAMVHRSATIKA